MSFGNGKIDVGGGGCWYSHPSDLNEWAPGRLIAASFANLPHVLDCDCRDIGLCPHGPPPHPPITEFLTDEERIKYAAWLPEPTSKRPAEDWETESGYYRPQGKAPRHIEPPAQQIMSGSGKALVARGDWKEDLPHCDEVPYALVAADGTPAPFDPSKCKSYTPKVPQPEVHLPEKINMLTICTARARGQALDRLAAAGVDIASIKDQDYRALADMVSKLQLPPPKLPYVCGATDTIDPCRTDEVCDKLIGNIVRDIDADAAAKALANKFLNRLGSAWKYIKGEGQVTKRGETVPLRGGPHHVIIVSGFCPKNKSEINPLMPGGHFNTTSGAGPRTRDTSRLRPLPMRPLTQEEVDEILRNLHETVVPETMGDEQYIFRHGPVINKNLTDADYPMWNVSARAIGNFSTLPGFIGIPVSVEWDAKKAEQAYGPARSYVQMALYFLSAMSMSSSPMGIANSTSSL